MKTQQPNLNQTVQRKSRGFTLVEMLLVLVILATLAAIVYPKVVGRGKEAKIVQAQVQIASFKNALDMFESENGFYPAQLMDLVVQPSGATRWHMYFDNIPKDPWLQDYVYIFPGRRNTTGYDLYSQGPPGEDKLIGNWVDNAGQP